MKEIANHLLTPIKRHLIWSKPHKKLANLSRRAWETSANNITTNLASRDGRRYRSASQYFHKAKTAGYLGWIRHGNLGDDAIHESLQQLFSPVNLIEFNQVPIEIAANRLLFGNTALYDMILLGGGTLINEAGFLDKLQTAATKNVPIIVFGTGVRDPDFWSAKDPGQDYRSGLKQWANLLKHSSYLSVRGPLSAALLESNGLQKVKIIGDPGLSITTSRDTPRHRSKLVGINLGSHDPILGRQADLIEEILAFIQDSIASGTSIEFCPMHASDEAIALKMQKKLGEKSFTIWQHYDDTERTLERIKEYDFLIGQRLHSVVFGFAAGVPSISLGYQPKCHDFMQSIGMSDLLIPTDHVTRTGVGNKLRQLDHDYHGIAERAKVACDHFRRLQKSEARHIIETHLQAAPHSKD